MNEPNARAFVLGFESGEAAERDRLIGLIEKEIKKITNPMAVNKGYLDGLHTALSILKEPTNE
jgi:hypothetical protein